MDDTTAAQRLISCLDLTSLNDDDTIEDIKLLCEKTQTPYGTTAAVCVYPQFIPQALQFLSGKVQQSLTSLKENSTRKKLKTKFSVPLKPVPMKLTPFFHIVIFYPAKSMNAQPMSRPFAPPAKIKL